MHERSEFHRGTGFNQCEAKRGAGDLWTPDQVSRRAGQATSPALEPPWWRIQRG